MTELLTCGFALMKFSGNFWLFRRTDPERLARRRPCESVGLDAGALALTVQLIASVLSVLAIAIYCPLASPVWTVQPMPHEAVKERRCMAHVCRTPWEFNVPTAAHGVGPVAVKQL